MSVLEEVISMQKNFIEKLRAEFFRRKPPSVEAARNREPECVSDYLWNKVLIDNDSIITETSVVAIMADLVFTGQETVTNNLCWLLLVMIHYPEVQEKIFQELSSKTDINHPLVSFYTPGDCHYTLATISETMRMYRRIFDSGSHGLEDVDNLHGFRIPKGSRLFGNIDIENFSLENFLNEKGEYQKHPCLIPFGSGPRSCIAENMARMEVFVSFASIVRKFKVEAVGDGKPSLVPILGFVGIAPKPFKVKLIDRII